MAEETTIGIKSGVVDTAEFTHGGTHFTEFFPSPAASGGKEADLVRSIGGQLNAAPCYTITATDLQFVTSRLWSSFFRR